MRQALLQQVHEQGFGQEPEGGLVQDAQLLFHLRAFLARLLDQVLAFQLDLLEQLLLRFQLSLRGRVELGLLARVPLQQLVHVDDAALVLLREMLGGLALAAAGRPEEHHVVALLRVHLGRDLRRVVQQEFLDLAVDGRLLFLREPLLMVELFLQELALEALLVVLGDEVPEGLSRRAHLGVHLLRVVELLLFLVFGLFI